MSTDDDGSTTEPVTTAPVRPGAADDLPPGRMLAAERYRVGDRLGRGGMGAVYVARDLQIGRDVAVKRLHARSVTDHNLQRFMREACIQGRLEHPAIVPVHELSVDGDGVPYFVMKKLAGTTLARQIADGAPGTRGRMLRAFAEVCLAVEFAHTRGFLHRDLKPDNIVLGDFGEVYVIDWGVAKAIGVHEEGGPGDFGDEILTREGAVIGTPGYMAPEQARGEPSLDARADVYALGCVLFEILAGERLHPKGARGLASAIAGIEARPSVRAPDRDISPELDVICVLATASEREQRIASARELGEYVQRYLDGDRDVALRGELAREYLADALAAFSAGDTEDRRRLAMRLAGRALALDPTSGDAAELVGRLMLEPPRTVPREVQLAVAADAAYVSQRTARSTMWATLGYLAMLPLLFSSGFRDPIYPIALVSLVGVNLGLLWWRSRNIQSSIPIVLAVCLLVALLGRIFAPFTVAPGVAAVSGTALMLGLVPATPRAAVALIAALVGAVLLPWLAEVGGIVSSTFELTERGLLLRSPGMQPTAPPNIVAFIGYAALLIAAGILVSIQIRRSETRTRTRLHLQAWQLRQLVPAAPPGG